MEETIEQHDISAHYATHGAGPYYPQMSCSCGWVAWEASWEMAGKEMDDHLDEVLATIARRDKKRVDVDASS